MRDTGRERDDVEVHWGSMEVPGEIKEQQPGVFQYFVHSCRGRLARRAGAIRPLSFHRDTETATFLRNYTGGTVMRRRGASDQTSRMVVVEDGADLCGYHESVSCMAGIALEHFPVAP